MIRREADDQIAISINGLGKMYKLYRQPVDRLLDAFGVSRFFYKRKNSFQEFWPLYNINLQIRRGERLGIVGRNGAGKSTLLKIITNNLAPTEGMVQVNGKIQALLELGTGFHPEFTGRQNIHASLAYYGLSAKAIHGKEEEIIDFSELGDFIDQPVKTYSAGMYARLAFSTATSIEPDILIIDEVLGAGDAYFASKCLERMRSLTEDSGATVLFVSHDLGSVQQMCDRVIWVDRGRILADGSPQDIVKMYYAAILEQEEVRLKARNDKLARSQHQAAGEFQAVEGTHELLVRLVAKDGQPPALSHPVKKLILTGNHGLRLIVEPGQPMDNDPGQPAYILADSQYMNWSGVKTIQGTRVRCFENVGGQYLHAPVVFRIQSDIWAAAKTFELEVEHAMQAGEDVFIQCWHNECYIGLGTLSPTNGVWRTNRFIFSPEQIQIKEDISAPEIRDKWDMTEAAFSAIIPVDASRQERSVFCKGEPILFSISIDVHEPLLTCWLVGVVYDLKGSKIAMIIHRFQEVQHPGLLKLVLALPTPNLRQGEYVWSFELMPHYDQMATEKMPFYSHWNRCVNIRVEETYSGHVPLGLVELAFTIETITDHA